MEADSGRKRRMENIEKFLKCELRTVRVIEVTDGEITLEFEDGTITLYLNHALNEGEGFPESFSVKRRANDTSSN